MDENEKKLKYLQEKIKDIRAREIKLVTSGEKTFKSLTEESIQEDSITESIRKMNEQWSTMWNDDEIKKLLEKVARIDNELIEELKKKDDASEFVDRVTRDGKTDEKKSELLLHEPLHMINFNGIFKNSTEGKKSINEPSFSTDFEKYSEQMKDFMDYVAMIKEIGEFAIINVKRRENTIRYSRIKGGLPLDCHEIEMIDDNGLKELYEALKTAYGSEFSHGCKHEMMRGYSLLPTIGENIIVEVSSDNLTDNNWIYEEVHSKSTIVDEEKKSNK